MMPGRKPAAALILGLGKAKPGPMGRSMGEDEATEDEGDESSPEGSDERSDAEATAAEDMIEAFKSGDAEALSDALKRHYKACGMGDYQEE